MTLQKFKAAHAERKAERAKLQEVTGVQKPRLSKLSKQEKTAKTASLKPRLSKTK
jgi:DNA-binding Xre family transcriptional regulator